MCCPLELLLTQSEDWTCKRADRPRSLGGVQARVLLKTLLYYSQQDLKPKIIFNNIAKYVCAILWAPKEKAQQKVLMSHILKF